MTSLCFNPTFRDELRRHVEGLRSFSEYVLASDEPELYRALLKELIAINDWLAAHQDRCRACKGRRDRRGGQ